jgi:hypothetical protein
MMNKSERARVLLSDEFFMGLVENQKLLYKNNIFNSSEDDVELREKSLIKYRAIEELLSSIQAVADDKQIQAKKWKIL